MLPQAEAISEVRRSFADYKEGDSVSLLDVDKLYFPAILACVESWNLQNLPNPVTLDNMPMSPQPARHKLISWLWGEITAIYDAEDEIPNE